MAERIVRAADISSYQGRPGADYYIRMVQEWGCRLAYIQGWGGTPAGTGANHHAELQLRGFRTAGSMTGLYFWLPGNAVPETVAMQGLQAAGSELKYVKLLVIDIEGGNKPSITNVIKFYDILAAKVPGVPIAMYCRANDWPYGESGFKSIPLIEARYVLPSGQAPAEPPSLDWHWSPFGGWTKRSGLQYAGTTPMFGVGTDLNVVSLDRLGIAIPTTGGGDDLANVTDAEKKQLLDSQAEILKYVKAENDIYVKCDGAQPIYYFDPTSQQLIHAVNPEVFRAQTPLDVVTFPPDHDIWNLPVIYPLGVPAPLRLAGSSTNKDAP